MTDEIRYIYQDILTGAVFDFAGNGVFSTKRFRTTGVVEHYVYRIGSDGIRYLGYDEYDEALDTWMSECLG